MGSSVSKVAEELPAFVCGILLSIAILTYFRVEYSFNLSLPVIASQIQVFLYLGLMLESDEILCKFDKLHDNLDKLSGQPNNLQDKSDELVKSQENLVKIPNILDENLPGKLNFNLVADHERWLYVWTLQFITILLLLLWWPLNNRRNVSSLDNGYSVSLSIDNDLESTILVIFKFYSFLGCFLTVSNVVAVGDNLFNFELNIYQCVCVLLIMILLLFVVITKRYFLFRVVFINMSYFVITNVTLFNFMSNIPPQSVNSIRAIVSFPFLAFTIVTCFLCCHKRKRKEERRTARSKSMDVGKSGQGRGNFSSPMRIRRKTI